MKYCPKCNQPGDGAFCIHCGTQLFGVRRQQAVDVYAVPRGIVRVDGGRVGGVKGRGGDHALAASSSRA